MASDVIGKGDTISREQAIGALEGELLAYPDNRVRYNTNRDAIAMLRALPSIAPDPVEAEYREAAQAHGEADIEFELCSCDAAAAVDCPHWNATVRTRVRLIAARAARNAR